MLVEPGARLGPYEIVALLGQGGMGAVYRAHDARLHRDVALKTLTDAVAGSPDRLARFQREAQLLASLNHPNIAQILGLEEAGFSPALVLELVEGPTLADLIKTRGPIPVAEAVPIARQIADALEFAHERGIVHRDLKPANVKVRPDGTVKVLDFGLAKALDVTSSAGDSSDLRAASDSPTVTSPAMTQMGFILGTAAYMAPEQAKGKPVDRRADIWAFGVVLYEMLTGRRAYEGEDVTDILAAVLTRDVNVSALPPGTPGRLRALVADCLVRDARQRLRDVGDARRVLEEVLAHPLDPSPPRQATPPTTSRWSRALPWAIAIVALVAAGTWAFYSARPAHAPGALVTRSKSQLSALAGFVGIAHDGRTVVYTIADTAGFSLAIRNLDQFDSRAIPGSTGAFFPVLSPDAQWIAFSTSGNNRIRKIPVAGGPTVSIADGTFADGADWGDDGTIVFSGPNGLLRVSAAGGTPEPLTTIDSAMHEAQHRRPQILPGGAEVLFTIVPAGDARPRFAVVDVATHAYRPIAPGGDNGRYASSGHLTFVRDGTLYATPFDLKAMAVTGPEVPVIESISSTGPPGTADYAFSDSGVLVYVEAPAHQGSTLGWGDRTTGSVTAIASQSPQLWGTGSLSPDGRWVANTIKQTHDQNIWVMDLQRGTSIRLTSGTGTCDWPIWMPSGTRVVYGESSGAETGLYSVAVDGSGAPSLVRSTPRQSIPTAVSPDGKWLLYRQNDETGRPHIYVAPLSAEGTAGDPHLLRSGPAADAADVDARFSPDGQWVALQSSQSGGPGVYILPFPGPGGVTPVSAGRSMEPRWSRNGRELFFWDSTTRSTLWSVAVSTTPSLSIGAPVKVFSTRGLGTTWDVAPDGRFLVELAPFTGDPSGSTFAIVTNWFDELRRLAPPKK